MGPREQNDLFPGAAEAAAAPAEGSLNYNTELRHVLSQALKKSPHTRYMIAARMSELIGEEITKAQLDAWTAESKTPWRFPFAYAAGFEAACETNVLQELLARKRGNRVLTGDEVLFVELGRIQKQRAELEMQERLINRHLRANKKK